MQQGFIQAIVDGITLGAIYALVSIGLTIIFGVIRVVNFAHGELLMIGMYAVFFLNSEWGMNSYLTAIFVVPLLFVIGVLLQKFVIQPKINEHNMQTFATFGLMIFFQNLALAITGGDYESVRNSLTEQNISLGGVLLTWPKIIILLTAVILTLGLVVFIHKTKAGRAIRAIVQDRQAARLMGINVELTYLLTFGLGASIVGLSASLITPMYTVFPEVGSYFVFASFVVVVLGGMGSIPGALAGGIIIGLMESLSGYLFDPALKQTFWFGLFIVILLFKPAGLFGIKGTEEVGLK